MDWLQAAEHLREGREPGVLVTLIEVRGHSPREPGAKLVVSGSGQWGTIGGGNLEATAVELARALLSSGATTPQRHEVDLSHAAPGEHGAQCCGGRVSVLLEPLPVPPVVVVFGLGHVGMELARILARHVIDLHLVDSRPERVSADALAPLTDALARVRAQHRELPEAVVPDLPAGTHVVILTHDHAQDLRLCDAALRRPDLGSIGLIGSSAKWRRFTARLGAQGHRPEDLARIRTPIGLPEVPGKDPASIAVSVAAELLLLIDRGQHATAARSRHTPVSPHSPEPAQQQVSALTGAPGR